MMEPSGKTKHEKSNKKESHTFCWIALSPPHTTRVPDKSSIMDRGLSSKKHSHRKPHLGKDDTDVLDSYDGDHRTAFATSATGNTTSDSDMNDQNEDLGLDPTVGSTKDDFSNNISDSNDGYPGYWVEDGDSDGIDHEASDLPSSPNGDEHTYYLQTNGLWATSDEEDDEDDMIFHSTPSLALDNGNPDLPYSFTPGGNNSNTVFTNTLDTGLHGLPSSPHPDHVILRPTSIPRSLNAATFDLGSNAAAYLNSAPTSPTNQRMDDFFRRLSLPSSTVLAAHGQQEMEDLLPSLMTSESSPSGDAPPMFAFSFPPSPPPVSLPEISTSPLSPPLPARHGKSPLIQSSPTTSSSSSPPQIKYDLASLLPVNMKIPDQLLDMIKASLATSPRKEVASAEDCARESSMVGTRSYGGGCHGSVLTFLSRLPLYSP